jgi:hypothetical protein
MLATVRTRSRPFAQTTGLQRLRVGRPNPSEPERTPGAAIAAIVIVATFKSCGPVGDPPERPTLTSTSVATCTPAAKISLQIRATEFVQLTGST